jgi:hypothetical protein
LGAGVSGEPGKGIAPPGVAPGLIGKLGSGCNGFAGCSSEPGIIAKDTLSPPTCRSKSNISITSLYLADREAYNTRVPLGFAAR